MGRVTAEVFIEKVELDQGLGSHGFGKQRGEETVMREKQREVCCIGCGGGHPGAYTQVASGRPCLGG